ncbi:NUDIX domain-containing protein [Neobacillus niacini]|uniref:NUDIX domain-containing protein n=1 Tax=Neobacillus niacini TaxID=86668 RepID=UPI0021CB5F9E|nr:NUDIX domain-containing protein [Neobacillus niacini]MCM3768503.1 NUDIX domain-containing protein [Neobacillus niacini]
MFYLRETYRLHPDNESKYSELFKEYYFPVHIKSGARLIGSWVTEQGDEFMIIWEYSSYEEYEKIEQRLTRDKMYAQMKKQFQKAAKDFLVKRTDTLNSLGAFMPAKHNVSVSGYITNENGETLLVKTYWRADTWELPGGGVDDGETLDRALCREILEETGIEVKLFGITGIYSNGNTISIVFLGEARGGKLTTSNETKEVQFVNLNHANVSHYIKRGKFIPRVLDAMNGKFAPYEAFKIRPYELIERLEGN